MLNALKFIASRLSLVAELHVQFFEGSDLLLHGVFLLAGLLQFHLDGVCFRQRLLIFLVGYATRGQHRSNQHYRRPLASHAILPPSNSRASPSFMWMFASTGCYSRPSAYFLCVYAN